MARIFSKKPNKLVLHDNLSNTEIVLFFRTPTTKEVASYTNGMTKRVRNKIVNCTGECRQKFGKLIFEGFREGDFGEEVDGKEVLFSSDRGSSNYKEDWKEKVCACAPDLIEHLAIHAFENTSSTEDEEGLKDPEDSTMDSNDPN